MAKPLSHYSPRFSNKAWADEQGFVSYFYCEYDALVKKEPKGKKQWGRQRGLYNWETEKALSNELENDASKVYRKLISFQELSTDDRLTWSQFLLSQLIRTPSFMRYERKFVDLFNISNKPKEDRIGCKNCLDINFVANREWCFLIAHEDDYFVRTDNPILQTGFIERPESCLYYPLTPKICMVVCSMPEKWDAFSYSPASMCGYQLQKGRAHVFNFYFAKSAELSLIISPEHDGAIADRMFSHVLGVYPQPPFPLHVTDINNINNINNSYDSILRIMEETDGIDYPKWDISDIETFYRNGN